MGDNARIDDGCAMVMANSLGGNCKLKVVNSVRSAMTENGWNALRQVLCNPSHISLQSYSDKSSQSWEVTTCQPTFPSQNESLRE
eukprot:CAMPEP_0172565336 /NCGR_PEP_ID=MMETSP1067-20121228/107775_1 /TAXON_ID=265564 ORGANISM="Thalassiosira punctigera, Strain Tpunct2005C2" /NCGR_SAMPLE_ID=MMETSP1067 /ASSEMBLY_ACC=CAM_ASM_000444 /LENGTH=84 /DNA_ID=CAMNT_0013356193 /DNA_START=131 /DNA_END=385 /DNA_ORIENTATION=+